MNSSAKLILLLLASALVTDGTAQAPAARPGARPTFTLQQVLERMDDAAKEFRTLSANLEYTKVTVVVNDTSIEQGQVFFRKHDHQLLVEMQRPELKFLLFSGNKAEIYYPKIRQLQEYNLEKHSALVDQFLLLGFGTEGKALEKQYLVTVLGESHLDGHAVVQLELTPKSDKVRSQISKIHVWLAQDSWVPIQQKFFETSGDYLIAHYTNIKVNLPLSASRFKIPVPKGVKKIKPQL